MGIVSAADSLHARTIDAMSGQLAGSAASHEP